MKIENAKKVMNLLKEKELIDDTIYILSVAYNNNTPLELEITESKPQSAFNARKVITIKDSKFNKTVIKNYLIELHQEIENINQQLKDL